MENKINLIAETAWHHEGDINFLKNLVSEICQKTNTDFVKLHLTLDFDEYMDKSHSIYENLKKWLIPKSDWEETIQLVNRNNKKLMLLFNDTKAIEFGMPFHPSLVEIHSVCLNDINLLHALKSNIPNITPIVLGIGGTTLYEIENALNILQHSNIILMFGFQNYPTKYEDVNFSKMRRIMSLFPEYKFGYADHTSWNEPNNIMISLMGAALGINYIEKHVTTHYGIQRCDWSAAISTEMFNDLSEKLQLLNKCNGNGLLQLNEGEKKYSIFGSMKKAALLKKDVECGNKLDLLNFSFKRAEPGSDLSQTDILEKIGFEIKQNLPLGTVLMKKHFE